MNETPKNALVPRQIEYLSFISALYFIVNTVIWREIMFFNILEDIFVQSSAAFFSPKQPFTPDMNLFLAERQHSFA